MVRRVASPRLVSYNGVEGPERTEVIAHVGFDT